MPTTLFVQTDSWGGRLLRCLGHPAVATPHLDAPAARWVVFRRAFRR